MLKCCGALRERVLNRLAPVPPSVGPPFLAPQFQHSVKATLEWGMAEPGTTSNTTVKHLGLG